jgi:hypothetical protein
LLLRIARIAYACAGFTALGFGIAAAQTAPTPAPGNTSDRIGGAPGPAALATPVPGWDPLGVKGLTISGTLRAYDFNRINTPEYNAKGAATGPNRAAFNFGGDVHVDYKLGASPFSVGGALWGAYPFGINGGDVSCNVGGGLIVHQSPALCSKNNAGIDNSLPGYALETFEYYVKYSDPTAAVTVGNQLLNKSWEPASDSRIKPSLYQGADATINVTKALAIGLTRITRFDNRTESIFDQCTLLTCTAGVTPAGIGSIVGRRSITTGTDRLALAFKPNSRFTLTTEAYRFHNIANLTYLESKYYVLEKNAYNPYFGVQFVNEQQAGSAILGRVQNQTVGLQLGVTPVKHLLLTVGADQSPWNYDTVTATSAAAATAPYFLVAGGTNTAVAAGVNGSAVNAVKVGADRYKVVYGGIASPYSDSYASDPLYTTSISQGIVDRRSAGFALKGALTYTTANKRFVAIASEASYNYDTAFARNRTYELDADVTYNFNTVRAGTYRGLSLRERFADRTQPTLPYNFKYLRHQLQYSF